MRRTLVLALVAVALVAGCTAKGGSQDPFAYAKKPLYTGHFELESLPSGGESQQFRVEDGSIARIRVQVWVNATAGTGRAVVVDPSGETIVDSTSTTTVLVPLELGAWKVTASSGAGSTGSVAFLVTRA